jgi:TetR/AcrR family transcriptional repressor of nem operon
MSQPPAKRLEAYFRMYRDTLRAGSAVCPAGAFAPGWDMIGSEVQAAVQALRNAQVAWLASVLSELGPPRRARSRAGYVFAACQGALISARMTGDVADFDEAISVARHALED